MALSSYDTLAVNEKGESMTGSITTPLGVTAEFYKTWLYISDATAWRPGGSHSEPTVMEIREGMLSYKDLQVFAVRGPKHGIYAALVARGTYHEDTSTRDPDRYLFGIGCYGYTNRRWTGVTNECKRFLMRHLRAMVKACELPEDAIKFNLDKALRYNQGDAFFARHLGVDIPGTKTGNAGAPMLMQMLKAAQ